MHADPVDQLARADDQASAHPRQRPPRQLRRDRRQAPRPHSAPTARDVLLRIEPALALLAVLQALVLVGAGVLALTWTTAMGLLAVSALGVWARFDATAGPTGVLPLPVEAFTVRAIVFVLCLPMLFYPQVFPFWHWLWLGGAAMLYPLAMPTWQGGLYAVFAALFCSTLSTLLDPEHVTDEAVTRATVFLVLALLARHLGNVIDEQARAFTGMQIGERRAQAIAANTDVLMVITDRDFAIQHCNPAVAQVLGYTPEQFASAWSLRLIHPADQPIFFRERDALLNQAGASTLFTLRVRHQAGHWVWLEVRLTNLLDNPAVQGMFCSVADVTARIIAEQRLRHQATHDGLTGLWNRTHFIDQLGAAMATAREHQVPLALFFCDLDHFKAVNDQYGHEVGDQFLLGLAERLRSIAAAPERLLARYDSDEFVLAVALPPEAVGELAAQILQVLSAPVRVRGLLLQVEASIGVASLRPEHEGPDQLIRDADAAMYEAKAHGRNRYAVFDEALRLKVQRSADLARGLRGALRRAELQLVFQPKVRLTTGELTGFEVLTRWESPEFGSIGPAEFIPLAEDSGMIVPVGLWVMSEACRWLAAWQTCFPQQAHVTLAVNVSMRQLMHDHFLVEALRVIRLAKIRPGTLEIEITETSAMINPEQTIQMLEKIKAAGLRLAMDDFGTGYSSLSWLRRLPVDAIKIDKSFVSNSQRDPEDLEIVRLVIALAQTLGIECIAEGIETEGQARLLRELGCQLGQGYWFDHPLTVAETEALLARGTPYSMGGSAARTADVTGVNAAPV